MSTTFAPWQATLNLGFVRAGGRTQLQENQHRGPLRVQKPFYPEGPEVCQVIVVHPPGGAVGGDELKLTVDLAQGAHALLTTPGATKWYRGNGRISRQQIQLNIATGAAVEWLPQETILYDAAEVCLEQRITLAAGASYIGCDILCFGRRAAGESFQSGHLIQRTRIEQEGKLVWLEQGSIIGGSPQLHNPFGLQGKTVCATLIAVGQTIPPALLKDLRQSQTVTWGLTQLKSVVVARYLGDSSEEARHRMLAVWQYLRPLLLGRAPITLRIWQT